MTLAQCRRVRFFSCSPPVLPCRRRRLSHLRIGVGGCSAFDVVSILEKARQKVTDCRVELNAERADAIPAVFTKIHLQFKVSGTDLNVQQVERAVKLSAEKYCSASIMLAKTALITHNFELIEK